MRLGQLHHRLARLQDRHDDAVGHELAHVLVERADQHAGVQQRPPRRCRRRATNPVPCIALPCPLAVARREHAGEARAEGQQRSRLLRAGHVDDEQADAEPRRALRPLQRRRCRRSRRRRRSGRPLLRAPSSATRNFAEIPNVPNWNDWSVRFAGAYDLFGNGKTAIKANASKYIAAAAAGYAANFNPHDLLRQLHRRDAWLDRPRRQQVDPRCRRQHPVQRSVRRHGELRPDHQPARSGAEARLQLGIQRVGAAPADGARVGDGRLLPPQLLQPRRHRQPEPRGRPTGRRSGSRRRPIRGCRCRAQPITMYTLQRQQGRRGDRQPAHLLGHQHHRLRRLRIQRQHAQATSCCCSAASPPIDASATLDHRATSATTRTARASATRCRRSAPRSRCRRPISCRGTSS